jgi:excisionase family DNA binding protein
MISEASKGAYIMSKEAALPQFLTVEEVAELLRVSPRSVYDWGSNREIPFHKAGRRVISCSMK